MKPGEHPPAWMVCPECGKKEAAYAHGTMSAVRYIPPRDHYLSHTYKCLECGHEWTIRTEGK